MQQGTTKKKKEAAIAFSQVSYEVRTIRRQSFIVLQDLNFSIDQNEFVCIVGPSGCGKTSTLNIIAGFIQPTAGQIVIQVELGKQIQPAMCFQSDTSFGWMSCKEN